jgi:hypothetical protein
MQALFNKTTTRKLREILQHMSRWWGWNVDSEQSTILNCSINTTQRNKVQYQITTKKKKVQYQIVLANIIIIKTQKLETIVLKSILIQHFKLLKLFMAYLQYINFS